MTSESQGDPRVELTVPARKDMLLVVRMTTAGVMARVGLTLDAADDMKMAVEEACSCLMLQKEPMSRIGLRFERESGEMRLTVRAEGEPVEGKPCDECTTEIIRCILESMVDEVTLETERGSVRSIEMTRRLAI